MIRSFRNKGLQRFAERGDASKLGVQNQNRVKRLLQRLDVAIMPEEMDAPGYFFHALSGNQNGRFSVRVTGNWRLTFAFEGENAVDVDLEDYH
jgi:proteic killer suppression protein